MTSDINNLLVSDCRVHFDQLHWGIHVAIGIAIFVLGEASLVTCHVWSVGRTSTFLDTIKKKVEVKSAGPGLDEGEQFRVNLYAIVVRPQRRALGPSNIDINRWPNTKFYEVLKSQSEV